MRSRLPLFVLCALPLVAACDEDTVLPSGAGGAIGGGGSGGGAGGGSAHTRELCARTCTVLAACDDRQTGGVETCTADCMLGGQPDSLLEECATCLEAVPCAGARLGCQSGPACDMAFDVRVTGADLGHADGAAVRVLVVEAFEGELWPDFARDVSLVGGGFDVTIAGGLPSWGVPFDVVVLLDADGDGACKPGSGDRAWRFPIGLPQADAHVHVTGDSPETKAACAFWGEAPTEVVLEGRGLDAWNGELVVAAPVWVDATFLSIGAFASAPIVDGGFRVQLGDFGDYVEEMAPDSELRLAWMVDLDHDWTCGPGDAGGSGLLPQASGLVQRVEAGPTAVGTAPCDLLRGLGHDVRLVGTGYAPHEGKRVEAVLLDAGDRIVAMGRTRVEGGAVRFDFAGMAVEGETYGAALWIDGDDSGRCAAPPDEVWRVDVGAVHADLERAVPYTGAAVDAAACSFFVRK